jgi:hypothetical protein
VPEFKPGDLVKITDGTHEDGWSGDRVGLVLDSHERGVYRYEVFSVLLLGTSEPIKIHKMFLEHFTSP